MSYAETSQFQFDQAFMKKIESKEKKEFVFLKKDSKEILDHLIKLSALNKIQKNLADYYENQYLTADHGDMIREEIKRILLELQPMMVSLTDTMQMSSEISECMLSPDDGDLYGNIKKTLWNAPNVFQRISIWKELVIKSDGAKL